MLGLAAEWRQHVVQETHLPDADGPKQDSLSVERGKRFESRRITDCKVLHRGERFCRGDA